MSGPLSLMLALFASLHGAQARPGEISFIELAQDGSPASELLAEVRVRPDDARSSLDRLLALAAGARSDSAANRHLATARRLADAYAEGWGDSTLTATVVRFRNWSPEQRAAKVTVDSLRRSGNAAMGASGVPAAIRLWRQSLARAHSLGDTVGMAAALGNIGAGFYADGQADSATVYLERSRSLAMRVRDYRTAGNSISALGSVSKDGGDLRRAGELYAEATQIRERIGDTRGMAADYNNLGLIAQAIGDTVGARRSFEQALALNRRYDRRPAAATNLVNLGNLAIAQSSYSTASGRYQEALAAYRSAGDSLSVALVLRNLGLLSVRRGDYPRAQERLESALSIYGQTASVNEAIALRIDLANVKAAMGQLQPALTHLRRAEQLAAGRPLGANLQARLALGGADLSLQFNNLVEAERRYTSAEDLFRMAGDGAREGEAQQGRGVVSLLREDYPAAQRQLRLARRTQERNGEIRSAATSTLLLGYARESAGDTAGARTEYLQAIETLHRQGDRAGEASALGSLAGLEAREGLTLTAESLYARSFARLADRTASSLSWWLWAGWGAALQSRGALSEAAVKLKASITELERMSGSLREPERRTAFLADKGDVYSRLARVEIARRRVPEAFEVSERLRARQMLDLLARGRIAESEDSTPSSEERDLRARITEITMRLEAAGDSAGLRGPDVQSPSLDAEREALARTQERYSELLLELRETRPEYADLIAGKTSPPSDLMRRLAPDEILLEYLVDDSASVVFAMTADSLVAIDLGVNRRSLARLVDFTRGTLHRPNRTSSGAWRGPLRQLYRYLIAPIDESGLLRGKHRLIVVPHAELHYLPFAALMRAESPDRFLIDSFEISYTPSASVWARLGERAANHAGREMLAVAPDPTNLPGASAEVDAISRIYGSRATILRGAAITESRFRALAPDYSVLHLATFGVLNQQNPLFSFVTFRSDEVQDGRLEVHEVFGLQLKARLVVLSACQTGLGSGAQADVPAGDDWVGLVRAFLFAGASNVVATAWPIEDRSTAKFMEDFYTRLGAGASESQALAEAQRLTLRRPGTRDPFYWAGFLLSGGR